MSKYFGRLKWIRTVTVGVGILALAFVVQVVAVARYMSNEFVDSIKIVVLFGALVAAIGTVGVVLGPRR